MLARLFASVQRRHLNSSPVQVQECAVVVPPVHLLWLVLPLRPVEADQPAPQPLPLTHLVPRRTDHTGESWPRGLGPARL